MPSELAASQAPSRLRLGRYETFFRIASGGMAEGHTFKAFLPGGASGGIRRGGRGGR